jgi:glucose/arabinose dehydrogenase
MKSIANDFPFGESKRLSIFLVLFLGITFFIMGCKKDIRDSASIDDTVTESKIKKELDLQLIAQNLVSPIGVIPVPDNTGRLFIIDQIGKIWIVNNAGTTLATPFLDLSSQLVTLQAGFDERGLLGLAFHPDYATNGRFFVYYNAPPRAGGPTPTTLWNNLSKISEFRVSANANVADMASQRVILEMDDPQFNHNGGTLAFGPDGYLYISIGDGGGANDVGAGHVEDWYSVNAGGNGQDIEANLFGNILRLDINNTNGAAYGIPPDNPFVNKAGRDEIYAYGLRNPYRMSFDMSGSRRLFVGDAGQLLYEEINVITKGGNYGWNVKEGAHCFNAAMPLQILPNCPGIDPFGTPLTDPAIEMNNFRNPAGGATSTTIIGGHVYRAHNIPGLQGKYVFGSFSKNPGVTDAEIFMAVPSDEPPWPFTELTFKGRPDNIGMYLKSFGQDNEGEIYIATSTIAGPTGTTGKVFKLVMAD